MTETEAFEKFHRALLLDPDELAFVRTMPDRVRDALAGADITVVRSELQGSVKKATALSPLTDVDLYVSLDPDQWGHPDDDDVDATELAGAVAKALIDGLGFPVSIEYKRHAIRVSLPERPSAPYFDLVIGFETLGSSDDVLIADFDDPFAWMLSWPRDIRRAVSDANERHGGRLVHSIRMIKHAVREYLSKRFPGLAVEGFACRATPDSDAYAVIAESILLRGADELPATADEPAQREDLIDRIAETEAGLPRRAAAWFADAADKAQRARKLAEDGDHEGANDLWFEIFGPPFPKPAARANLYAAAAGLSFGRPDTKPTRAFGDD